MVDVVGSQSDGSINRNLGTGGSNAFRRLNITDTLVLGSNRSLKRVFVRGGNQSNDATTMVVGFYDVSSGAADAPLLETVTATLPSKSTAGWFQTDVDVDFSAHSGKTIAIGHANAAGSWQGRADGTSGDSVRDGDGTSTTLPDPWTGSITGSAAESDSIYAEFEEGAGGSFQAAWARNSNQVIS